jgi:hypothetical protein
VGREANCHCRWSGGSAAVKALLETHELILRGELRRTFAITALSAVAAEAEDLRFTVQGETYALALGAEQARRWALKIATPPPTLAEKLGVGPTKKARVIGRLDEPVLKAALEGAIAALDDEPALSLAVISDSASLDEAVGMHASGAQDRPLWIVHGKGPGASFGEAAVRRHMRAAGYIDLKVSAVSETLSATRYARAASGTGSAAQG